MNRAMEIPLHRCFADLEIIEYLGILWPERSRRTLSGLISGGLLRSAGRRVGMRERTGDLEELTLAGRKIQRAELSSASF